MPRGDFLWPSGGYKRMCLATQLDFASHDAPVTREGAKESVVFAFFQLGDVKGYGGAFTAADHVSVGDHALVTGFNVVVVQAGFHAIGSNSAFIGFLRDNDVVAHGCFRQLAGVFQVDREFLACLVNNDALGVELHGVIAFDGNVASSKSRHAGQSKNGCESKFGKHSSNSSKTDKKRNGTRGCCSGLTA